MGAKENLDYMDICPFYINKCEIYSCADCVKKGKAEDVWLIDGFLTTEPNYPDSVTVKRQSKKTNQKIKSDGGSSTYYDFEITNAKGETITVNCGDVIRAMVANDFSLGNILKACRRISEAKNGRGKQGIDISYDKNKIVYFAKEI